MCPYAVLRCFVFRATISAFVSCVCLSSWNECALFLFLSFDVACCVIFLYVCVVAVCSFLVAVWLLWCIGCGSGCLIDRSLVG